MKQKVTLPNVGFILYRPRYPENIGAAVRAMRNMGLGRLLVVAPENYDLKKIEKMATHDSEAMVRSIELFDEMDPALEAFEYLVGTSARTGKERQDMVSPRELVPRLVPVSEENRIGVIFGPENKGLPNWILHRCHDIIHIPTADFKSINLAQSVMLVAYELYVTHHVVKRKSVSRLAKQVEIEGMFGHLKTTFETIGFVRDGNPDYWLIRMRRFFGRNPVRASEVQLVRGICKQVLWYANKRYKDGLTETDRTRV
ncbi:MAG: rRNA methyltransferase [Deltaproteobacteria bacterium]|nr:MAG: rRNA methyltransferase [Deltaproteobacteria bacterium]